MKKSICLLLISLLLCGTVTASSINYQQNTLLVDELDQSQTVIGNQILWIGRYDPASRQGAQSFIPGKGILTRVELYLSRWEVAPATEPFYLSVRETLTGATLTEISVNPNSVPIYDYAWITFDLPDTPVDVGKTYFLVAHSDGSPYGGLYLWRGTDTNPYASGMTYYIEEDDPDWLQSTNNDMGFKTYGIDNDPPEKPTITGTVKGEPGVSYNYTFTAVEPDGENIKYIIDWADGNQEETGFVSSGESATVSHTWTDKGLYIIKAKAVDSIGKESDWGILSVRMPKTFSVGPGWQWFQHQFPLLTWLFNFVFSPS